MIKILIVDDHPMTVMGYQFTLEQCLPQDSLLIETAHTQDEALYQIQKAKKDPFNIIFLDISLPPSSDGNFTSGDDLGRHIRKICPKTKLIVLTMLNNSLRIKSILQSLEPEAFLIKTEITSDTLSDAFFKVKDGFRYYSKEVYNLIQQDLSDDYQIDEMDRKILYYLSIGEKMKNFPEFIPLSMATIERRKKNLKYVLGVITDTDRALLEKAREKGFL